MCKPLRTQNFRAPNISWYSFGDICRPFQPSHLQNHEVHFFTKLPTKQSSYAVVHRQPWPCANPFELKIFVHQEFDGNHLGKFVGLSNPHISKTTNFIFFTKLPTKPSSYVVVHRPTLPSANSIQFKTFLHQDFYSTHLGTFIGLSNPHISKTTNFIFHKTPHQAIYLCRGAPPTLPMCKTLRTQNFHAPWISCYSFGDICRPFQPSHLKNHEFHFFTKLPTEPYGYATMHRPTWPSANSIQFKTFVHQDFYNTHLGTFEGLPNHHISKTINFNFSQNSPPSHLPMPWCTANVGHVQTPPNSKLSCTKISMVFIWGNL